MKAKSHEFARGLPRAAAGASIFFFCGPDEAGAWEAANRVIASLPQAGERVELSGAELKNDAARLGDEARSVSLFGGARHIVVRCSGDEAHDALAALIETGETGAGAAAPVIVVATSATDKSRTAKLLEKRKDALVAMFYPPDVATLAAAVRAMADAAGLRLGGDLAERIARGSGLDLRLARSEVEKLALYVGADPQSPRPASAEDHAAIGAATEEDGFQPVVNAVLGGDIAALPGELRRMREHGLNAVGLLLAIERRAALLARIMAAVGPRGSFGSLDRGARARLGIFWKEENEIARQYACWSAPAGRGSQVRKLDRLVPRLAALHRALMTNSQAADLLLAQDLAQIARFAAKR
ncbi:DNA polymerase III subunit delta [Erythrobacter sp.]|uniref:DNA polymerase III subunit delta n=1 Tax=Erythrobacter sp. TaxID=1042 RepID=UPI001425E49A|nr:DNA polymerase III subunit delta [Erythrobacter sp.]QIQ87342.1 MAG: DNA polymerase III subunit delta [Erythrobacter sp.]